MQVDVKVVIVGCKVVTSGCCIGAGWNMRTHTKGRLMMEPVPSGGVSMMVF